MSKGSLPAKHSPFQRAVISVANSYPHTYKRSDQWLNFLAPRQDIRLPQQYPSFLSLFGQIIIVAFSRLFRGWSLNRGCSPVKWEGKVKVSDNFYSVCMSLAFTINCGLYFDLLFCPSYFLCENIYLFQWVKKITLLCSIFFLSISPKFLHMVCWSAF